MNKLTASAIYSDHSFLDQFFSGHMVVNEKRQVVWSNRYLSDLCGGFAQDPLPASLNSLFTKASIIFIDSYVYPLLIHEGVAEEIQLTLLNANDERIPVVVNIKKDANHLTYWSLYDCANRDKLYQELISAKEQLELQRHSLIELAAQDPLTGLLNRRELSHRAKQMLSQAQRTESPVAMLVVDFFKVINDKHGHALGDEVLRGLSDELSKKRREYDIVARFGGEEFVLVLFDIDDHNALKVANTLRSNIEARDFNGIKITVSIGISMNVCRLAGASPHFETDFETLFDKADSALYDVKNKGRNNVQLSKIPSKK